MRPLWLALLPGLLMAQFHRAEQDLEIHYWLLEPDSHQFRISHDFTVSRSGQKYVHSFVRKGSVVTKSVVIDLNTGKQLETNNVTGKSVNALGYYPTPADPESVVGKAIWIMRWRQASQCGFAWLRPIPIQWDTVSTMAS
jgi:hypothetical protein